MLSTKNRESKEKYTDEEIERNAAKKLNSQRESKLGIVYCAQKNPSPVFNKISGIICNIITKRKDEILDILNKEVKGKLVFDSLTESLYSDFCSLKKPKQLTKASVLEQIVEVLESKEFPHAIKRPLFGTFSYRILRELEKKYYQTSENELKDLSAIIQNAKEGISKNVTMTKKLGLCFDEDFQAELNEMKSTQILLALNDKDHASSVGKQIPKELEAIFKNSPVVAGPSTHTFSMFTTLLTLEKMNVLILSKQEKYELSLDYAMYLVAGGYHTLDEVMSVADLVITYMHHPEKLIKDGKLPKSFSEAIANIKYEFSNYKNKIPLSIQRTTEGQKLMEEFGVDVSPLVNHALLGQRKEVTDSASTLLEKDFNFSGKLQIENILKP